MNISLNEKQLKELLSGKIIKLVSMHSHDVKGNDGPKVEVDLKLDDIGLDRIHFVVGGVTGSGLINECTKLLMRSLYQIKEWHNFSKYVQLSDDLADMLFGSYYNMAPEMKFLRDVLGNYESIKEELKKYGTNNNSSS